MPCLESRAEVLGVTARLSKERSKLGIPDCASKISRSTLSGLFAAPEVHQDDNPRAGKRRKLDNAGHVEVKAEDIDESDDSVVLTKVDLHLNLHELRHASHGIPITKQSFDLRHTLPLSFEWYDRAGPDTFQIRVFNVASGTGATINAELPKKSLDLIEPELKAIAQFSRSREGKSHRSALRAVFSHCLLHAPTVQSNTYRLQLELRWRLSISVVEHLKVPVQSMKQDLFHLRKYLSISDSQADKTWNLSDFYDAVHVPPTHLQTSPRIPRALSNTTLYPFQERAVDWLLRREGVQLDASGKITPYTAPTTSASFKQTEDATGRKCYVSSLRGMIVSDLDAAKGDALHSLRGGILAEEMGLGKTVELIALMSLNKRDTQEEIVFDAYTGTQVRPTGATLIISPPSILEQWISELNVHAPELKVFHYTGLPSRHAPKREHEAASANNLLQYDVVVTTYNVLSREIHFAKPPPDRSLRNGKRHERPKSPLMELSWWRVCLDEAQMIENGVSQAATVARIIPRCNAWAVSGTPLRKDVQDLRGLLIFLRCDVFANNKAVWDRLDKASFQSIFGRIAMRHTKDKIREELRLPPQKRVVITVPFTTIEEQNYSDLVRQMCDSCWMSPEGVPMDESRDASHPDVVERMREWLVRLRQTCLHAHVGRKNRRALGARNGVLRTVHEVLEIMIEQNDSNWKTEARELILQIIKLGHIKAYAGDIDDRAQKALGHYEEALKEAQSYVQTCREDLTAEHHKFAKVEKEGDSGPALLEADSEEDDEIENVGRMPVLRKNLRSFLEVEHMCDFFIATSWHQIKENESFTKSESEDYLRLDQLEADWYQKAKLIRRELLNASKRRALSYMHRIESRKALTAVAKVTDLPDLGGLESRKILDTMDNIGDFLNAQADQIELWRKKIVEILLLRLIDDDDDQETTGEEYDESLKAQDELYVYIMALRTLVADRNTAITGLQDILIEHELKTAEKQALKKDIDEEKGETRGHAPELVIEVAATRRKLQAGLQGGSLKGVVSGVRSLLTALQWRAENGDNRAAAEMDIAQKQFTKIQEVATQQAKIITELEREQELFRSTMNQRLEYYRQFQHISDTVAKYKEDLDETFDKREFEKSNTLRERKAQSVAALKTKHTYLAHLRSENVQDAQADCIICQDLIEVGVLTTCGHKYCKECIKQWWQQHRTCPMCKQKLSSSDFKDISFKPGEIKAQEENHSPDDAAAGQTSHASTPTANNSTSIYSDISDSTLKEIKMIDLNGSYGTKIDMIARHLLWIRANDPGAKSLIFSQFGDFLDVLREAMRKWKIGASSITDKNGIQQFKFDPAIECFLLDAKSDSSGLNLVNATYVFLCEPLINPALELQAIARVHRIGQQRQTTVFMYLINDTVEEAIYEISVKRRLEHMRSGKTSHSGTNTPLVQEDGLDKANSKELQAAPLKALLRKKMNGEEVKEGDLWRCLFGKGRRVPKVIGQELESEVGRHLRGDAAEERRMAEGRF